MERDDVSRGAADERTLREAKVAGIVGTVPGGRSVVTVSGLLDGLPSTAEIPFAPSMSSHADRFLTALARHGEATFTGAPVPVEGGRILFSAQRARVVNDVFFADPGVLTEQPGRALDGPDGPRSFGPRGEEIQPSVLALVREGGEGR